MQTRVRDSLVHALFPYDRVIIAWRNRIRGGPVLKHSPLFLLYVYVHVRLCARTHALSFCTFVGKYKGAFVGVHVYTRLTIKLRKNENPHGARSPNIRAVLQQGIHYPNYRSAIPYACIYLYMQNYRPRRERLLTFENCIRFKL